MNLSEYLVQNTTNHLLTEAIRNRDIEKGINLIASYLRKRSIFTIPVIQDLSIDNHNKLGVLCYNKDNDAAVFVWDLAESAQVETVLFTSNFDAALTAWSYGDDYTWDVEVQSKGANAIRMCKLVEKVLTGKIAMTAAACRTEIVDAQLFESLVFEKSNDPELEKLERQKATLYRKIRNLNQKGEDTTELQQQYDELRARLSGLKTSVRGNVKSKLKTDIEVVKLEDIFDEFLNASPEERLEDMVSYATDVIRGTSPLVLICGAPGVGKSYHIEKLLKKYGKIQGSDFALMKGKCTATSLYTTLHDYKDKGKLVVFDDCDSIFKDDDAINLLKAAFDSSDERWVAWGVSRAIPMSEEMANMCDDAVWENGRWYYPKNFEFEGGGIILTNYSAGQIDTAIRNRALICDLNFTVDEVLDYIERIMPNLKPGILSNEAKQKTMEYFRFLASKNAPLELSIRTFNICAGIYMSDAPENVIKRKLAEQMKNQALRGGKKY